MKRYLPSMLAAACIAVASLVPVPDTPLEDIPSYDKWTHFLMYGALSLILWHDHLRGRRGGRGRWPAAVAVAVVLPIAMSGALELAQARFTTCRSGDWLDFAANSVGVALAALCACVCLRLRRRREKG